MRTFIAIDIPQTPAIKKFHRDLKANLKDIIISFANVDQYHITLAFLGETPPEQATAISHDLMTLPIQSLEIDLKGTGLFKSHNIPKALWVGIKTSPTLQNLWLQINETITKNGFIANNQDFKPHLTIGRIKNFGKDNNLDDFLNKYRDTDFGTIRISEAVFYQSIISTQGTLHKVIERFKLTKE